MNPTERTGPVADLILERYFLDELPMAEMARLRARLEHDEPLRQRLEDLKQSNETFRRAYSTEWMADQIRARLRHRDTAAIRPAPRWGSATWKKRWTLSTAAVAVTLLLLVILPQVTGPGRNESALRSRTNPETVDRIKGLEPDLALFRKTADGSETLTDSAVVHPGDLIRAGYRAAGRPWGAIVSVDGRGVVTLHLPVHGTRAAALQRGDIVLLDSAYELDDTPGWERFYFVTADTSFDLETVTSAARHAAVLNAPPGMLPLPAGLKQFIFTLRRG